jgi:hypothetical protein
MGVLDGIGTAAVSLVTLTLLVRLFGVWRPTPRGGVVLTAILGILKLPLLLLGIWVGTHLAGPGLYCFLASVGLVYSVFIWGLARGVRFD